MLRYIERLKERDPLAVLQEDSLAGGEKGGQFNLMKLAPNFEMAMYLAQATGSCIVTDSPFRWGEVRRAIRRQTGGPLPVSPPSRVTSSAPRLRSLQDVADVAALASNKTFAVYPALMRDVFKYLSNLGDRGQSRTGKRI